ncbi:MAG: hypothetical protein HKL91_05355 [Candidatus Eremiobacteraeota bacterium]|uniref:Uncharacterized protein n=1 Tax=mine drainage metagenome TaxID=410659 RepID=E6PFC6_9ZZZZ|nr:hypothetical protein [Candidatus Eremiobacteraeota bacterium]
MRIVRLGAIFALVLALGAAAKSTPTPAPTPTPVAAPRIVNAARREFLAWQLGSIDPTHYIGPLAVAATPARVKVTSIELGHLGALDHLVYLGLVRDGSFPGGGIAHLFRVICSNGYVYEEIALDKAGLIRGILFRDTLKSQ